MKLFFTSVFILTFCSLEIFAQNISNEGTEFWLCFPSHVAAGGSAGGLASLSVFITSKNNTSGVVTCGTSKPIPFSVVANTVTEVVVDRNASYLPASTTYINQGIRVLIDDGQPKAVVYAHVFAGARSAATLVLPKVALGQKYYTIAYSQQYNTGGSKSQFEVVCVEPNTKLNITLRLNGVVQPTPLTVTLANVGDVYQYQNDQDISGTLIEVDASTSSCKRFAAFSGSSALAILAPGCFPPGSNTNTALNPSYDPLFQQLYPLESWGQKFPLIPFSDRNTGAIFRVLASVNNTMVSVAGLNVPLNAGEFYETKPLTDVGLITADKPVMVAEYALTEYCADSRNYGRTKIPSDPDMVILNPLEYSIKDVTMYSSTKLAITEQFINVMILTAGVKSFKINKVDYSARFSQVPGNNLYSYAQINLTLIGGTNFNLTADVGFNAMAYGFGNFESYAYSAGTNLAASIFLNAVRPETDEIINNACLDEPFDFRLVLPYMSQKLIWTIDSGETITQDPPKPKPITVNGKLLFEYRLKLNKTYKTAGTKKISIVSTFPSAGGCSSGDEVLNFDFEVYENPVIKSIQALDSVCINNLVQYDFTAPTNTRPIESYFWDFGDSTTSSEKNPVHIYKTIGKKKVSLYVKSDVSCVSNIISKEIQVFPKPLMDFSMGNINCSLKDIQFKDLSQLLGNKVKSYQWDFGDGSTSPEANPIHIYQKPDNYVITLKIVTESGCETTLRKSKIIYDSPVIDFAEPAACVTDQAKFVATTTSLDVNTYQWDFGDGKVSAASSSPEVLHQYVSPNIYTVKLIAVSVNGCETVFQKPITISGSQPKANFNVISIKNLCSNQPVQFQDLSTVNPGKITKLEWIYNYTGSLTDSITTIINPKPNAIYPYKYPASKDDVRYKVRLRAYSGTECSDVFGPIDILVKGSPDVRFDPTPSTCLNINPFKITQAKELTRINGSGVFSGTGVSPDGYFNPIDAGLGTFEITYTFTATSGCTDTKKQNITVFPVPVISIGAADAVILLGGQTTLKASATGEGLSYQWQPSLGLSNDKILNPTASPKETTTYNLTVTSSDGCIETAQVNVIVAGLPEIPNTFTPNNDGLNDTWNIKYLETYVNAKITIFNRFGNPVFNSLGYDVPWDGKTKGKEVPVGVYYYIIDPKNGDKPFSGSVTVIR